jgi:hypothetical protein
MHVMKLSAGFYCSRRTAASLREGSSAAPWAPLGTQRGDTAIIKAGAINTRFYYNCFIISDNNNNNSDSNDAKFNFVAVYFISLLIPVVLYIFIYLFLFQSFISLINTD